MRHDGDIYFDWKQSQWATDFGLERFFSMSNGVVTIKQGGIYQVYAQVMCSTLYLKKNFIHFGHLHLK